MTNITLLLKKPSAILIVVTFLVIISLQPTSANPIDSKWSDDRAKTERPQSVNECGLRGETKIQAVCQRCAKSTKSDLVYPMCCENREDARQWCHRYLEFGIHSEDTKRHNMDT